MEDKDVNEFLLTVFVEWVRRTAKRRRGRGIIGEDPY